MCIIYILYTYTYYVIMHYVYSNICAEQVHRNCMQLQKKSLLSQTACACKKTYMIANIAGQGVKYVYITGSD